MSFNKTKLVKSIQSRGNYFIGPNEIWTLDLSVQAKIVYIYLIAQSDSWKPGVRAIGDAVGCSSATAARAVKELVEASMIQVDEADKGMRNTYTINGTDEWTVGQVYQGETAVSKTGVASDETGVSGRDTTVSEGDTSVSGRDTSKKNKKRNNTREEMAFSSKSSSYDSAAGATGHEAPSHTAEQEKEIKSHNNSSYNSHHHSDPKDQIAGKRSQDDRNTPPAHRTNPPHTMASQPSKIDQRDSLDILYRKWSISLPKRIEPSQRRQQLNLLLEAIKDEGYCIDDLTSSLKKKVTAHFYPAKKLAQHTQEQYDSWIAMVEADYEAEVNSVFLEPIPAKTEDELNEDDFWRSVKSVSKKKPWLYD